MRYTEPRASISCHFASCLEFRSARSANAELLRSFLKSHDWGQSMTTNSSAPVAESADVVVVGFGAAGVCAAIAAREQGAEVVAIDRANGGGATTVSGGIIYAGGGTTVQKQAGVDDSFEQMLAYLRLEVGDVVSQDTLESFVHSSPEMISWLSNYGVPFDSTLCPYKTSFPNNHYYLYHSGSEKTLGLSAVIRHPSSAGIAQREKAHPARCCFSRYRNLHSPWAFGSFPRQRPRSWSRIPRGEWPKSRL